MNGELHLPRTACEAYFYMDDGFNELIFFRCGELQGQQWRYYVTASWLAYPKLYLVRDRIIPCVRSEGSSPRDCRGGEGGMDGYEKSTGNM